MARTLFMGQEESELICYCFNHTRADIERDLAQNGRSLILEAIIAAKRMGACRCAVKNPKGT
jgi:hypothetical protein